jgi:hypothetical protein
MSIIFRWTKLFFLSKWKVSWVIFINRNKNVRFQPPSTSVFTVLSQEIFLLEIIHPLKIYRHKTIVRSLFEWCKFSSTWEILLPLFWDGWRCGIEKYGVEVTLNGMASLLNFINYTVYLKRYNLDRRTGRQTDRMMTSHASRTFMRIVC